MGVQSGSFPRISVALAGSNCDLLLRRRDDGVMIYCAAGQDSRELDYLEAIRLSPVTLGPTFMHHAMIGFIAGQDIEQMARSLVQRPEFMCYNALEIDFFGHKLSFVDYLKLMLFATKFCDPEVAPYSSGGGVETQATA